MKARIGGKTTLDSLPAAYREAVKACSVELAEKRWAELSHITSTRFLAIMALALNDVFGFGTERIRRVMDAMDEIAIGYSEESYSPSENRNGTSDLARMANAMLDELKARGIRVEIE